MITDTHYDYEVDPFATDTPAYLHVESAYYDGDFADATAPSAANYPPTLAGASTRYFLNLPGIIDVSALGGARPISLRDVTSEVNLTRVSGSPGANEYRIPSSTSERRHTVELHSGQAGHKIGFDFYMIGGILLADEFDRDYNVSIVGQQGNDLNIAGMGHKAITSLSSTRIAFIDDANDDLRAYDFDGTDWTQTGNDLNIAGVGTSALTALASTRVAFIDSTNNDLRTYDFDGTNWTQTGNDLNIAGVNYPALTALSSTRVAFIDTTNKDLRTYDFDGTDWTQTGNDLNIAGIMLSVSLTTLSNTRIAFFDQANDDLRAYDFDGTDWTQTGNDLNIAGAGYSALASISNTNIAFIDNGNKDLRIYDFDGTDWTQASNDLNIAGIGAPSIASLSNINLAFLDETNDDLRTYVLSWSPILEIPFERFKI